VHDVLGHPRCSVIGGDVGGAAAIDLLHRFPGFVDRLCFFNTVPPEHDVTNELAAYKLADVPFPGFFGIFYQVKKPTKNAKEAGLISASREKVKGLKDWQILQKSFDRMK